MDKTDYFDKVDALVNDKQTYEELKRDPTPALQRKLNSKILTFQARSKQKMTGGAERVAHISSPPPPTSVPRLNHTSWYMSYHYSCVQYLLFCL